MRAVICGGIRYESVNECAERTEYSVPQLYHALHETGRIGYDAVYYAVDQPRPAVPDEPAAPREPLLHAICRHRLGTYHGGSY